MAVVTLEHLRTRTRRRADMIYSQFVSNDELNEYINASAQELYDLLVSANLDYYTALLYFTLTGTRSTFPLPASTVYKIRGLDVQLNGDWSPVYSYEYLERSSWTNAFPSRLVSTVRYRLIGNNLEFLPTNLAANSYRLRYVPFMTPMVRDTDTFDGYNGFEEYIIVDAAIKAKDKEESSVTVLMAEKADLKKRILAMANTRDYGEPSRVEDVRRYNDTGIEW